MNVSFNVSKASFQGHLLQYPSNASEWHGANAYFTERDFQGVSGIIFSQVKQPSQHNPGILFRVTKKHGYTVYYPNILPKILFSHSQGSERYEGQ